MGVSPVDSPSGEVPNSLPAAAIALCMALLPPRSLDVHVPTRAQVSPVGWRMEPQLYWPEVLAQVEALGFGVGQTWV